MHEIVRVVSDILESNGSSSMATVCAGTLALMDAGVKIKKPVSGIAMGLIKNAGEDKYAVLSDILGDEDHLGDMDFKVTGTKDGITATQPILLRLSMRRNHSIWSLKTASRTVARHWKRDLVFDLEGELLEDRLVVENHAMMMYTPFLEDNAPDGGREEEEK